MTSSVSGFTPTEDLCWRSWNGVVGDVWSVDCSENAQGYYVSEDPRLFVLLDMAGAGGLLLDSMPSRESYRHGSIRSMSYVPAGLPLQSRIDRLTHLRHLDLHFDAEALTRRFADDFDASVLAAPRIAFQNDRIAILAELIAAECSSRSRSHDLYGDGLINALFVDLFRIERNVMQRRSRLSHAQLRRAKAHIEEHALRNIRLKELADLTGLSQSYFSHAFKAATGVPPHRWHMQARIDEVKKLLAGRQLSMTEIATAAGFADQAHFSRVFKAMVGVSPAAWLRDCNSGVVPRRQAPTLRQKPAR